MNRSFSSRFNRTHRVIAVAIACITALAPSLSLAASATINFGFGASTSHAAAVVAPTESSTIATTNSPVYRSVQTSTEIDASRFADQPAETAQGATPASQSAPKTGIGVNAVMSDNLKIYTIPLSYSFNRNLGVQLNLPLVTAKIDNGNGGETSNTGIGDLNLTVKHRIGSENGLAAFYTLATVKFASGDADKGLGTGTYDISITEKVIKRFGDFRGALMFGVTQPLNNPVILGSKVEYGANISYMAALEHTLVLPELWFGVRAGGLHAFETKIAGIGLDNSLTTLDLTPEFNYFFKRNASVNLGVIVPVYTDYALPGGSNDRDVAVSFGISMLF